MHPFLLQSVIQQDGEVGDHSTNPAYYSAPFSIPTLALPVVLLSAYDQDDQPSSPSYNTSFFKQHGACFSSHPATPMTVQILSLPAPAGSALLYFLNGTVIEAASLPVTIRREMLPGCVQGTSSSGGDGGGSWNSCPCGYAVRIRPAAGQYSNPPGAHFLSFRFTATDGVTGLPAIFPSDAHAMVVVTQVNHPPIAQVGQCATAVAGALTKLYPRGSISTESTSPVVSASIESLPRFGSLFVVYNNGSVSKTPISQVSHALYFGASAASAAGMTVATATGGTSFIFSVAYFYSASQSMSAAVSSSFPNGEIGADSFSFSVIDAGGRRSVPAVLNITVQPSLVAMPAAAVPLAVQGGNLQGGVLTFAVSDR